jgi:hypothetical protein
MRCPYCRVEVAFWGEEHGCPWPELSRGDPPTPYDFGGSDDESHYVAGAVWEKIRREEQSLGDPPVTDPLSRVLPDAGLSREELRRLLDVTPQEASDLVDLLLRRYPALRETLRQKETP